MLPAQIVELIRGRSSRTAIAVIGASNNPEKTGNAIVKKLARAGFTVRPVNPTASEIEGVKAFPNLDSVPDPVDIVNIVTPPEVTFKVLSSIEPGRFETIWFQEGSFDDECVSLAGAKAKTVITGNCIMVAVALNGPRA